MNAPFLALLPHGLDWIWIVLIVVLLFGPKKLPELARGLGKSIGEFKKAKDEFNQELQASLKEQPQPPANPAEVPPGSVATTATPHPTPVKPSDEPPKA